MSISRIRLKQLLLLAGDLAIFQLAVPLMLFLRYGEVTENLYRTHSAPCFFLSLMWLVGFYVAGLYDLRLSKDALMFLRTFFEGVVGNLFISFGFFYLLPIFGIAPRRNLLLFVVIVLLLEYVWRLIFNRLIAGTMLKTRICYIGRPDQAMELDELIQEYAPGFELRLVLQTETGARFDEGRLQWTESIQDLRTLVTSGSVDLIVVDSDGVGNPALQDMLYETVFTTVQLMDRTGFEELATHRVSVAHISQNWFLAHIRENEKVLYETVKRVSDFLLAIPMGLFALLLYPFIALAIKFSSSGPVIYSQIRIGRGQKPFRIYKFRTMRTDAEADGSPRWAQKDDPRLIKIGKFLRAFRLDELPQIWNVLRGDMSLIGPRPERPEFVEALTKEMPYYALRHLTRPGLTGWAQVQYFYAKTMEQNLKKLQYDLYYIKHRSVMLDIAILLKTIRTVLKRLGT